MRSSAVLPRAAAGDQRVWQPQITALHRELILGISSLYIFGRESARGIAGDEPGVDYAYYGDFGLP